MRMRFLIEASQEEIRLNKREEYEELSTNDKEKLVADKLSATNVDSKAFAYQIVKDGGYYEDHPLYKISFALPDKKLGDRTMYTILKLGSKDNSYSNDLANSNWLSSEDLFQDSDANTAWKLKALLLAQSKGKDISKFKRDGHFLPINKFKSVAEEVLADVTDVSKRSSKKDISNKAQELSKKTGADPKKLEPIIDTIDETQVKIDEYANLLDNTDILKGRLPKGASKQFVATALAKDPTASLETIVNQYIKALK